jgi:hypothetical protein
MSKTVVDIFKSLRQSRADFLKKNMLKLCLNSSMKWSETDSNLGNLRLDLPDQAQLITIEHCEDLFHLWQAEIMTKLCKKALAQTPLQDKKAQFVAIMSATSSQPLFRTYMMSLTIYVKQKKLTTSINTTDPDQNLIRGFMTSDMQNPKTEEEISKMLQQCYAYNKTAFDTIVSNSETSYAVKQYQCCVILFTNFSASFSDNANAKGVKQISTWQKQSALMKALPYILAFDNCGKNIIQTELQPLDVMNKFTEVTHVLGGIENMKMNKYSWLAMLWSWIMSAYYGLRSLVTSIWSMIKTEHGWKTKAFWFHIIAVLTIMMTLIIAVLLIIDLILMAFGSDKQTGVLATIAGLFATIKEWVSSSIHFVKEKWNTFYDYIVNAKYMDAIKSTKEWIFEKWNWVYGMYEYIRDGVSSAYTTVKDFVTNIFTAIVNFFRKMIWGEPKLAIGAPSTPALEAPSTSSLQAKEEAEKKQIDDDLKQKEEAEKARVKAETDAKQAELDRRQQEVEAFAEQVHAAEVERIRLKDEAKKAREEAEAKAKVAVEAKQKAENETSAQAQQAAAQAAAEAADAELKRKELERQQEWQALKDMQTAASQRMHAEQNAERAAARAAAEAKKREAEAAEKAAAEAEKRKAAAERAAQRAAQDAKQKADNDAKFNTFKANVAKNIQEANEAEAKRRAAAKAEKEAEAAAKAEKDAKAAAEAKKREAEVAAAEAKKREEEVAAAKKAEEERVAREKAAAEEEARQHVEAAKRNIWWNSEVPQPRLAPSKSKTHRHADGKYYGPTQDEFQSALDHLEALIAYGKSKYPTLEQAWEKFGSSNTSWWYDLRDKWVWWEKLDDQIDGLWGCYGHYESWSRDETWKQKYVSLTKEIRQYHAGPLVPDWVPNKWAEILDTLDKQIPTLVMQSKCVPLYTANIECDYTREFTIRDFRDLRDDMLNKAGADPMRYDWIVDALFEKKQQLRDRENNQDIEFERAQVEYLKQKNHNKVATAEASVTLSETIAKVSVDGSGAPLNAALSETLASQEGKPLEGDAKKMVDDSASLFSSINVASASGYVAQAATGFGAIYMWVKNKVT